VRSVACLWLILGFRAYDSPAFPQRGAMASEIIPFFGVLPAARSRLSTAHSAIVGELASFPSPLKANAAAAGLVLDENELGYEEEERAEEPLSAEAATDVTREEDTPLFLHDDDIEDFD
jgi:hypothetical protein